MAAAIGVGLPVETPTGNMVIDIGAADGIAVIALSGIVSDTSIGRAVTSWIRRSCSSCARTKPADRRAQPRS